MGHPVAVRLMLQALASHHSDPGPIPGGSTPGPSHVGIVVDDAAFWRVFSRYFRFPRPCMSGCPGMMSIYGSQLESPSLEEWYLVLGSLYTPCSLYREQPLATRRLSHLSGGESIRTRPRLLSAV
ncbi:hypothetical protein PR048_006054 [Dryococelus australis]|uniref:Uncharacterized protein n=1 Tax=Dryococelus australis TaxID=614101 RepID=A0ABQ9I9X8_9NEOP|nr:hypothetical protein PR048_006054 [Dryococelus australis]